VAAPRPFSPDTSPEVQRLLVERWRAMPTWRKAELVNALSRDCERLALAGIRERHPDATPEEARLRLGALRLGRELMIQAFGWDPVDHP
jgi:hypothetical protein